MGRDGGRKLAPNLFLIPSCHRSETLTHVCLYGKKKNPTTEMEKRLDEVSLKELIGLNF